MSQPTLRRVAFFVACLALAAGFLVAPRDARAHAKLLRSEPKPKSRLPQPPKAVELWFSEGLQAGFNAVEVKDGQGNRFERGEVTLEEGGKKLRIELRDLTAGAYTVEWKALSSDEHTLKGKFTFTVEAAAAPAAAESATPQATPPADGQQQATPVPPGIQGSTNSDDSDDAAGEEASSITAADSLVRWLGYLSMMALAGGFALWLFVLGPALRSALDEGVDPESGHGAAGVAARRSLTLFRASVAALILSTLLALAFQSAAVHGVGLGGALAPSRLAGVVAETGYGKSWLVQAAGAAALLVVILLLGRTVGREPAGRQKVLRVAGLAASAFLMLGPSLTGHAAVAARHFPLAALSDWLHLVAGAVWVGGLFHLALALPPALSKLPRPSRADALGRVIPLFTRVALPAVALVLLAGLYNSWLHLGGWAALWNTSYGRTLLVKLLLVLAMLALGGLNNFYFGRRVKRRAGEAADHTGRGFARSLRLEAALGVLVLLVTAFLVFTTPGRNDATASNPPRGPGAAAEHR
ncbi:MAG: copper resistance protein CopC/CopD [Acidobacteriota bacterium]|nr:copper resistance protein CopC/CopD [Acidobacteriota bacterium]